MELDDATKNLAEAKLVLDSEVRKKMKVESHLGELTDLAILKEGAEKVERYLPVLKGYHPTNNTFDGLPDMIQKEIAKFIPKPEPKIVEKEESPKELEGEIKTEMIAGEQVDILKVPKSSSVQPAGPVKIPRKRPSKKGGK